MEARNLETNVAGSNSEGESIRFPSDRTLKLRLEHHKYYFENSVNHKEYHRNAIIETKQLIDMKKAYNNGNTLGDLAKEQLKPRGQRRKNKHGYLVEIINNHFDDLIHKRISQSDLARKYNVNKGSLCKQLSREKEKLKHSLMF